MSLAGLLRCSFQGVKNKIAMCFRYGGTGEAEGEKLLSAISLFEGTLKNSNFFTEESMNEWTGYLF